MFLKNEGFSLLYTLAIIFVLGVVLTGFALYIQEEIHIAANQENRAKAFYVAESGIEYAWYNKEEESIWDGSGNLVDLNELSAHMDGDLTELKRVENSDDTISIFSTGKAGSSELALEVLIIRDDNAPEFDKAVYADEDIDMQGGAEIDGDAATNEGYIYKQGGATVTGDETTGLAMDYEMPDFPVFPAQVYRGTLITEKQNETYKIDADGYYDLIRTKSDRDIFIDMQYGDRTIVVRNLDMRQGDLILENVASNSKLRIYIEETINMQGSSHINRGGEPAQVYVYYKGTDELRLGNDTEIAGSVFAETADLSIGNAGRIMGHIITGGNVVVEGGSFSHSIYAPEGNVTMKGGANTEGVVISKDTDMQGGTKVTYKYDETMAEMLKELGAGGWGSYVMVWK